MRLSDLVGKLLKIDDHVFVGIQDRTGNISFVSLNTFEHFPIFNPVCITELTSKIVEDTFKRLGPFKRVYVSSVKNVTCNPLVFKEILKNVTLYKDVPLDRRFRTGGNVYIKRRLHTRSVAIKINANTLHDFSDNTEVQLLRDKKTIPVKEVPIGHKFELGKKICIADGHQNLDVYCHEVGQIPSSFTLRGMQHVGYDPNQEYN